VKQEVQLVRYDAMCQAIDRAFDVDEVKDIHDKAVALEAYFRQAKNPEPERRACEIRLRAERKAGRLLGEMKKVPGARTDLAQPLGEVSEFGRTLEANQISRQTSTRWQQLAAVPDEDFEAALAGPEKPSTNGIISQNRPKREPMNDNAIWLWGRLRDFETDLFKEDPNYLLSQMLDTMQDDVRRLVPLVIEWMERIKR
jgi:hypothetical protein